jgi:hypothetical protein
MRGPCFLASSLRARCGSDDPTKFGKFPIRVTSLARGAIPNLRMSYMALTAKPKRGKEGKW